MYDGRPEEPQPSVPQEHDGSSTTTRPTRELYSALMSGLGNDEQHQLERMMRDNEERLRQTGDGYAP